MNKLRYYLRQPNYVFVALLNKINRFISDNLYLAILYFIFTGRRLNIKHPRRFTEKIQWLKLYDYQPDYIRLVDKFSVKELVSERVGSNFVIPTLCVWNSVDEINWDILPEKFVLKTTHGGGGCGVVVCKDKAIFDKQKAIDRLSRSMQINAGYEFREKPYLAVPRRIIAEPLIEDPHNSDNDLPDYKFYCFNGEPIYCQVIRNRSSKETIDFYDMQWNLMPFVGLNPLAVNSEYGVERPIRLHQLKDVCRKLSYGMKFARIDLYVLEERDYFGEITLYPASGMGKFNPDEWDYRLGDLLKLA